MPQNEKVLVVDFGGQYNQLVARRVRECNVYCEIVSYRVGLDAIRAQNPKGIIFTGGPNSVYVDGAPTIDPAIFDLGIPVLGLCYGFQLMTHLLGGHVCKAPEREYGKTLVHVDTKSKVFENVSPETICWMSHNDYAETAPTGFTISAYTDNCPVAAIELPDGTVVTGKTGPLLGAASSALLNALKKLAGIDQEIDLVSARAIAPIQTLKTNYLGSKNPRLHTDEILIALSSSVSENEYAAKAMEQIPNLKGCDIHSTVILSSVDADTLKKLGMYLTCEPTYEEDDRMYHKK